jgi:hypothetical protein
MLRNVCFTPITDIKGREGQSAECLADIIGPERQAHGPDRQARDCGFRLGAATIFGDELQRAVSAIGMPGDLTAPDAGISRT